MKVLWLDDEGRRVSVYSDALGLCDHEVKVVGTLKQFRERLQEGGVQVVLIDVMLPTGQFDLVQTDYGSKTGLIIAREVQTTYPGIRVILFTNHHDTRHMAEMSGLTVLSKMEMSPWDLNKILEELA